MTPFTINEIAVIRAAVHLRESMRDICHGFARHTRDEIVEAIDATRRHPSNQEAMCWANLVLAYQAAGHPLVNGVPVLKVQPGAMF